MASRIVDFTDGVFHSLAGMFLPAPQRHTLKSLGFKFHWESGSPKCPPRCVGCEQGLPDKIWLTKNGASLDSHIELLTDKAKDALDEISQKKQKSLETSCEIDVPKPDGMDYFPYQKAGIAYAMDRSRVLFGDEMGLGKTLMALGWVNALGDEVRSILVVCPASLKINWLREANKWLVRERVLPWVVMGVKHRCEEVQQTMQAYGTNLVIVNYELLTGSKGLTEALLSRTWDMLIVDEAHRLKTLSAQRSKAILGTKRTKKLPAKPGLVDRARRIAFLTGTPIPNRPKEFFPLAQLMDPELFGNEWAFLQRYCGPKKISFWKKDANGVPGQKSAWDFSGASNLGELQHLARSSFMVRRTKKDVWREMPQKVRQILGLQPTSNVTKLNEALKEKLKAMTDDFDDAAMELMRPETNLPLGEIAEERKALGELKVPVAIDFIELALEQMPKVVVFAHHHCVVEALRDAFAGQVAVLYGPTNEKLRQKAVDDFQNDPSIRVFIGTGAAGEGITLTAASHVIFVESSWVPGEVAQREDRVHRIGQKEHRVTIQHLVWDSTIEAAMLQRVVQKQRTIDAALDR